MGNQPLHVSPSLFSHRLFPGEPGAALPGREAHSGESTGGHDEPGVPDEGDPAVVVADDDEEGAQVEEDEAVAEAVVGGRAHLRGGVGRGISPV